MATGEAQDFADIYSKFCSDDLPVQLAILIRTGILPQRHVFYELIHRFVKIASGGYEVYANYKWHKVLQSFLETFAHFIGPLGLKLLVGHGKPATAVLCPEERVSLFNIVHSGSRLKGNIDLSTRTSMRIGGWQHIHHAAFLQLARRCYENRPPILKVMQGGQGLFSFLYSGGRRDGY